MSGDAAPLPDNAGPDDMAPDDMAPDAMAPDAMARAVEAALFAATEPMSVEAIATHLGSAPLPAIRAALGELASHYARRGVHLVERGRLWHFQTAPDLAHLLRREHEEPRRLSRAATECLAIIAYHEPVSRAEIEAIRGVQTAKGTLDTLLEAGWVRIAGRREVPGRPVIYATTPEFLVHFGLPSRRDLPGLDELKAAGLLDPVDDALEAALSGGASSAAPGRNGDGGDEAGDNHGDAPDPASDSLARGEESA